MVNKGIFSVSQFAFVCLPQTSETERKRVNKNLKLFFSSCRLAKVEGEEREEHIECRYGLVSLKYWPTFWQGSREKEDG